MTKIKDEDYITWIKQQPCALCGWKPPAPYKWVLSRTSTWQDKYKEGRYYGTVAAHHAGDGFHSRKYSDLTTIPLCDLSCDSRANNCHHKEIHANPKKYNQWARDKAKEYRKTYEGRS